MAVPVENDGDWTDPTGSRSVTGYMPIENYGLIGNMRTSALVAIDGGLDYMYCHKGGHFTIGLPNTLNVTTKQQYVLSSNILQTQYLQEDGVLNVVDFFPRPTVKSTAKAEALNGIHPGARRMPADPRTVLKKWLVRRAECIRGDVDVHVEIFPAFNYARDKHETEIIAIEPSGSEASRKVVFKSASLSLEIHATIDCDDSPEELRPKLVFEKKQKPSYLGLGVYAVVHLREGQSVSFVLRDHIPAKDTVNDHITNALLDQAQKDTATYWYTWISQSKYKGRWCEKVNRSLMILKLLTYEPTGAIIAAPTFSLPEAFEGTRNWDYRFSWVRDSSFTIYILLRMGFTEEAEAYMSFISDRLRYSRTPDGALPIVFSIRGSTDLPEIELSHLAGYRNSKPVRIGNGATFHTQLDIYGELMDATYLYNKYGKPVSYDHWRIIREITDYVCGIWHEPDKSIWEVRGHMQNFVYSKIMLWVAIDRALR
ncbi:hypothetical protein LTR28_004824, partial [Elasticomyces elasticus]